MSVTEVEVVLSELFAGCNPTPGVADWTGRQDGPAGAGILAYGGGALA